MSPAGVGLIVSVGLHGFVAWGLLAIGAVQLPVLQSRAAGGGGGGAAIEVRLASGAEINGLEQEPAQPLQEEAKPEISAPVPVRSAPARAQPINPERAEPARAKLVRSVKEPQTISQPTERALEGTQGAGLGVGSGTAGAGDFAAQDSFGDGIAGDGPRIIRSPKPPYPREARRAQFEGRVVFEILIDASGRVQEAKLDQSSGRKDCDEAARDTIIERWRFSPATFRGVAIPWRQRVAVAYRLR